MSEWVALAPSPVALSHHAAPVSPRAPSAAENNAGSDASSSDAELQLDALLVQLVDAPRSPWAMPWAQIRPLLLRRLRGICVNFDAIDATDVMAAHALYAQTASEEGKAPQRIEERLGKWKSYMEQFDGYPFTIGRLAELLVRPRAFYVWIDAYMRAIDKLLLVTSCAK